jgi:hypothetical protein
MIDHHANIYDKDKSNVLCQGVIFDDGKVCVRWINSKYGSTVIWDCIGDFMMVSVNCSSREVQYLN